MFIEEARWLKEMLAAIEPKPGWTLLDIGSSTEYFRRVDQPYIDYYVFRPLRKLGVKIIHVDARRAEGVDVVCDLADPTCQALVEEIPRGDVVLCSNLLEHVRDRELVRDRLCGLTGPGGCLFVTVPHLYRYHEDPIDTMYRPTDRELAALFSVCRFETLRSTILEVDCGYPAVPQRFVPYYAYRIRNLVKRHILKREIRVNRCKVAAVVLQRPAIGEPAGRT
jgi:hypothetical protein